MRNGCEIAIFAMICRRLEEIDKTMAILDEQQKVEIKRWLHSSGSIDGFRCRGCDSGRVMEPTVVFTLPDADEDAHRTLDL
jgi:hypothetical protein